MRITQTGGGVFEGILIVGLEGAGKSFIGNMLCSDAADASPPFEENEFSVSFAPSYTVHEMTEGQVVECAPNATAMRLASKLFSKACPIKTIVFVWTGALSTDAVSLFETMISKCPQPSNILLVHNHAEVNGVASKLVVPKFIDILDDSPWHYVDCQYVAVPHNSKPSFPDAAVVLQSHVIN